MSKALVTASGNGIEPRPVKLPGFEFHWNGQVIPVETASGEQPTIDQFTGALEYACASHKAAPTWVGYLIVYAEDRGDWAERFDQAIAFTGLSRQRLHNLASVVRNVPIENIQIAQTTAHASEVQPLPPKQQKKWLDKSATEGWSKSQLRVELRKAKRPKVSEGTTEPEPASAPTFDLDRLKAVRQELLDLQQLALDTNADIEDYLQDAFQAVNNALDAMEGRDSKP